MADGSVRFLSDQIDYGVYVALMTPDGATSDAPDVPLAAGGPATWGQAATWRTIDAERLSRLVDGQR
jgi:hypothetical protein